MPHHSKDSSEETHSWQHPAPNGLQGPCSCNRMPNGDQIPTDACWQIDIRHRGACRLMADEPDINPLYNVHLQTNRFHLPS